MCRPRRVIVSLYWIRAFDASSGPSGCAWLITRSPQNAAGKCSCRRSIRNNRGSIDEHPLYALGILVGFRIRRRVVHGGGIEDDDIGLHPLTQDAAVADA